MAFTWTNSVSGKIKTALLSEMRTNLDWLDNNTVCRTNNATVDNDQHLNYFTAKDTVYDNNLCTGVNAGADNGPTSDERLKKDIVSITGGLETIQKLVGVEWNWKDSGTKSAGVIAQQLECVLPHLVGREGEYKTVYYHSLTGYLIEAVKELSKQVAEQNARIIELEGTK